MTNEAQRPASSLERAFAFIIVGVIALSLIAFLSIIIGTVAGVASDDGFSEGVWPAVIMMPLFGLPSAFVLIVVLLIMSARRRRSASANGR